MALTDLQRALAYGESELGEVAILKVSDGTYTINRARRRQRACGWNGGGNHQGARRCDTSICVEDHHVNMH
jgi:hypothetical protein